MKQSTIANFQVIGRCAKMQTLSWEDELQLLDGVPYNIDFSRGMSIEVPEGTMLRDVPVSSIVGAILNPPEVPALPARRVSVSSTIDWDELDRQEKKKEKRAKKWKQKHPKRSVKEAYEDICNLRKEWGID